QPLRLRQLRQPRPVRPRAVTGQGRRGPGCWQRESSKGVQTALGSEAAIGENGGGSQQALQGDPLSLSDPRALRSAPLRARAVRRHQTVLTAGSPPVNVWADVPRRVGGGRGGPSPNGGNGGPSASAPTAHQLS